MFSIGEVARQGGVTVETLRYYEREGLLAASGRASNGYRHYTPDAIRRLRFIKQAQAAGFTLGDIGELLSLQNDPAACCGDVRDKAVAKMAEIEKKIAALRQMKSVLYQLAEQCLGDEPVARCPIIDRLEKRRES